jgi:hypothetical protein
MRWTRRDRDGERGQGLVEFAMIVPVFMLILLGLLELGFAFDHVLTLSYATREGARTGAALANGAKLADCGDVDKYVVAAVERVLDSPGSPIEADLSRVTQIRIFKATGAGAETSAVNVWVPGAGPSVDGKQLSYRSQSTTWSSCGSSRNNQTASPDSIGVAIRYTYHAVTPLASVTRFFGGPGWATLPVSDQTVMALNPSD